MNVAFIPVRGGSKSIPLKNIKSFAGRPLVYWVIKAAVECLQIDKVYVSTDCSQIGETVKSFCFGKVAVIKRSERSATDTASTEEVMIEFAREYEFDNIVLIQATSPLLTAQDIERGLSGLGEADSVLSVVKQKRFIWSQTEYAQPVNYHYEIRPRRQDFDGFLVENGAFYITSKMALLESQCRLSGKIKAVEMPEDSYFEIDELTDWLIAEKLFLLRKESVKCSSIKMFITDCDGTLTDSGMYYSESGEMLKRFHTRDGAGLRLLKEKGIITVIMTGEDSEIVRRRGEKLKVDEVLTGVSDKLKMAEELCQKYQLHISEVAVIGDDVNDLELLKAAGLSVCPADAVSEVKEIVNYIMQAGGGHGAVREAAEYILDSHNSNALF